MTRHPREPERGNVPRRFPERSHRENPPGFTREEPPSRQALQSVLERCGFALSPKQLDQLWSYHGLLRSANAELNLTRIHQFDNMVLKHYVDSLLVTRFVDLPSPLMDMGSGAGLPGIPLKILRPDARMILAEPRGARVDFLRAVIDRLGLTEIEVYPHKIGPRHHPRVAGIITRAVASIPDTLELTTNCLGPGGLMIFMKGPGCDAEIAQANELMSSRFQLAADHPYQIPGTAHDRRLVLYHKSTEPEEGVANSQTDADVDGSSALRSAREITSSTNPTFQRLRDLLAGRGLRKHGQALIAGSRIIEDVLRLAPDRVAAWITPWNGPPPPTHSSELTWLRLLDPLHRELDVSGTHAPLLLVNLPEMPEWNRDDSWPPGCTLFVPFQDPENVGAVIRSAAAFGVARVVLLREAAHPFHPKSARAAGPALFQVPLFHGPSLSELVSHQVPFIALDAHGQDIEATPFPPTFGLVVGMEGPGLPLTLAPIERRRIPIDACVESLNAATAAAVALYAWSRRGTRDHDDSVTVSPPAPPDPSCGLPESGVEALGG